jgi:hypothetical protein
MLKKTPLIVCLLTACLGLHAQKTEQKLQDVSEAVKNITADDIKKLPNFSLDLLAAYPFGKGAETYSFGFSARLTYTNNPYGYIPGVEKPGINDIPTSKVENIEILTRRVGWQAGLDYTYLGGKKEDIGPITYEYDNLSILHLFGGVDYDPCPSGNIELSTGPAIGFYGGGGESEFGYGATLSGHWSFTPSPDLLLKIRKFKRSPITFGAEGGLGYYKFADTDPIFTVRMGVRMTF